ncbi:MLP-like protein 31 [Morella rubra]|uniref:MLP-like protein 31 n=1 Tax=Morella rubra TaxID=262757 RepID=A0A6A1VFF9_9ROSI|nr:MLP-like protein 31 [Morella rubra]
MAQLGKLQFKVDIKSPADKFFGFFKNNMTRLVQIFPENYKSVEILGGGVEIEEGSVVSFKYVLEQQEYSDDCKNKGWRFRQRISSITFTVIEGDMLKLYKSVKANIQVTGSGSANWVIEYEKANDSAPDPEIYKDLAAKVVLLVDILKSRLVFCDDVELYPQ